MSTRTFSRDNPSKHGILLGNRGLKIAAPRYPSYLRTTAVRDHRLDFNHRIDQAWSPRQATRLWSAITIVRRNKNQSTNEQRSTLTGILPATLNLLTRNRKGSQPWLRTYFELLLLPSRLQAKLDFSQAEHARNELQIEVERQAHTIGGLEAKIDSI